MKRKRPNQQKIWLDDEEKGLFRKAAELMQTDISEMCRRLVRRYLQAELKKEKTPSRRALEKYTCSGLGIAINEA